MICRAVLASRARSAGDEPTQDQLDQARAILEQRVNGMERFWRASRYRRQHAGDYCARRRHSPSTSSGGQTSQLLFRPVAQQPTPNPAELTDTLETWPTAGWNMDCSKQDAEETINQLFAAFEEQADDAAAAGLGRKAKNHGLCQAEPENSLEQAERRDEITEMLIADRQSEDPRPSRCQCSVDL